MKIDRATWQRIQAHFDELLDLPAGRRADAIERLALPDSDRRALEALLAAHDAEDDGPFARSAPELLRLMDDERVPAKRWENRELGPWLVESHIADGGMSVVYAGRRNDGQFEKRVAIKVLKSERLGGSPERLVEEIRILAPLEHPNIARLIDSGTTGDGDPYLVMEYIDGTPIDAYCNRHALPVADRVRLVVETAAALEYAHRRQVIHCDVKPANLLVHADGRPTVVDFGIAALTRGDIPSRRQGVFWSPGFSPPERLRNAPPDTTQDVFGLGAVLHRLLSDAPAQTPRDLQAIVDRACAEAPDDRYRSMTGFRADLEAWLERRPVSARDGGRAYAFGRWIQRHRVAAALGSLFVASLVAGTGVALYQAEAARHEAARANAVRDLLVDVFTAADPAAEYGADPPASVLLRRGRERVVGELADQPLLLAELLQVIGHTQYERGLVAEAADTLDRALALFGSTSASATHARALADRGMVAYEQGDVSAAIDHLQHARRMAGALNAGDELQALIAIRLADMQVVQGDAATALESIDEWLDRADRLRPGQLAQALRVRGAAEQLSGDADAAVASLERALALQQALDADDVFIAKILNELGIALTDRGEIGRALGVMRRSLSHKRRIYGELHPQTLAALGNIASLQMMLGRHAEAERTFVESLGSLRRIHGDSHPDVAFTLGMLAWSIYQRGDLVAAEGRVREALEIVDRLPTAPTSVAWIAPFSGLVALELGRAGARQRLGPFTQDCHDLDAASPMTRRICLARALLAARAGACPDGLPPKAGEATLIALPQNWRAIHARIEWLCGERRTAEPDVSLPVWALRSANAIGNQPAPRR